MIVRHKLGCDRALHSVTPSLSALRPRLRLGSRWVALLLGMLVIFGMGVPAHAASTTLVSTGTPVVTGSFGSSTTGNTGTFSTSADGRYVAFQSTATNLTANKTSTTYSDIFLRDTQTGTTKLISVSTDGTTSGNNTSTNPSISADGRYVAFTSKASNLVTNGFKTTTTYQDVLLRDTQTNTTTLVSIGTDSNGNSVLGNNNSQIPSVSANGRYVAFYSSAGNLNSLKTSSGTSNDIFLRDTQTNTTTLISVSADGTSPANSSCFNPSISADGRYVAFQSQASNLTALKTTTTVSDIFLRDTQTNTTSLISVNTAGTAGGTGGFSYNPTISADGRYVAFDSFATNLNANKTSTTTDVLVRDTVNNTTALISVAPDGTTSGNNTSQNPVISGDGRYVTFQSKATNLLSNTSLKTNASFFDIFLRDTQTNTTTLLSVSPDGSAAGNNNSQIPSISVNGRYVSFYSFATNISASKTRSTFSDVFLRDTQTNTTTLVSMGSPVLSSLDGDSVTSTSSNSLFSVSANGRYVAFSSKATNLTSNKTTITYSDVFVRDTQTNTTTLISVGTNGTSSGNNNSFNPSVSADGRYVAFYSNATNLNALKTTTTNDIFLRDTVNNTTTLISVSADGTSAGNSNSYNPSISSDGRYVAFQSFDSNLTALKTTTTYSDILVRDTQTNTTTLVTVGTDGTSSATGSQSYNASISGDGRYVAFESQATNLNALKTTTTYTDVFLRDTVSNTTKLLSISTDGTSAGNNSSNNPNISGDGRYVAFHSKATNLTANKTSNTYNDILVRDTQTNATTLVSVGTDGTSAGNNNSIVPGISADGRYIVFQSNATNLNSLKTTTTNDILVRDTQTNTTTLVSVGTNGTSAGNNTSQYPGISSNGRYVAFQSKATNLIASKTDSTYFDVFLRDVSVTASTGLIISEFRQRGTNGTADEYVELYNTTNAALDVSGWLVQYTGGGTTQTVTLPTSTTIPALGHYLIVGSAYSLTNYGGTAFLGGTNGAPGNQTLSVDMADGSPIILLNPSNVAQDTVTFGGTTLPSAPTSAGEYAFVRQAVPTTSLPVTTPNAFTFVGTTNTSYTGTNGSLTPALGAPGPENLNSPTALQALKVTLLDPGVAQSVTPNRVRVGSGSSGTLSIRRLVTNNTGAPINKLRFRIVNLTTLNSAGYSNSTQTDLRGAASGFTTQSILTSSGNVTVYGTTPDTSITQNLGGGINSSSFETASGVVTLSTALPASGTRAYDFTFNVMRPGTFTILLLFEEANSSGSGGSSSALGTKPDGTVVIKPSTLGNSLTLSPRSK